eukprot:scaffold663913_cov61-Prasinocladus_malaysianus.AAC.1
MQTTLTNSNSQSELLGKTTIVVRLYLMKDIPFTYAYLAGARLAQTVSSRNFVHHKVSQPCSRPCMFCDTSCRREHTCAQ